MTARPILVSASLLLAAACSSPGVRGGTWLITSGDDTITVSQARESWGRLRENERRPFLEGGNPSEEFVRALTGRTVLDSLARRTGYLSDPDLEAFTRIWLRVEASIVARSILISREREALDSHDIELYRNSHGTVIWFTTEETGSMGPLPIYELPRELASSLETLAPGEEVLVQGFGISRLDSIQRSQAPPSTEEDDVIADIVAYGRERFRYLATYFPIITDSATVVHIPPDPAGDPVVIRSPVGEWTLSQLEREAEFIRTRIPAVHVDPDWIDLIAENMIMQTLYQQRLPEICPESFDSLGVEGERYRRRLATENMLRDYLDIRVVVERSDLEEEYDLLPEPIPVAPRRVFRTASAGIEDLPGLRASMGTPMGPEAYPPAIGYAAHPENPRISRPLWRNDLPDDAGAALFQADPNDTLTWLGPYEIEPDYFVAFQLREVMPLRHGNVDELHDILYESARLRLESEAVDALLDSMITELEFRINRSALESLPSDPGLWP